jgi:hypothetical protein
VPLRHWEARPILHDYDPTSDQDEANWLAAKYDAGLVPEYGHGIPIELNGRRVHRRAMIEPAD